MTYSAMYVDVIKQEYSLSNYEQLGNFLGVAPSAISRYIQDTSPRAVNLIRKHLIKKGVDFEEITKKVENYREKLEKIYNLDNSSTIDELRIHLFNADQHQKRLEPKLRPKESEFIYPDKYAEDEAYKKREEQRELIRVKIEKEKEERLKDYIEVINLLSETKNGFSKEFQYAFWRRFNNIKDEIFNGFADGYWDGSAPERTWDDAKNDQIDMEFQKLLEKVVDKDNLKIFESWSELE